MMRRREEFRETASRKMKPNCGRIHLLSLIKICCLLVSISDRIARTNCDELKLNTTQIDQQTNINQQQQQSNSNLTNHENRQAQQNSSELLVESLAEQLIKQSNLQAEESQQVGAISVVAAPAGIAASNQRASAPPASFTGGSGNSYMSISRDGSNRYEFGYDTAAGKKQQRLESAPGNTFAGQTTPGGRPAPRLMREESRLEDGTVIGRYGYTDPFNVFRIVQYVAGPDGYFASEDVGALAEDGRQGGKLQLNKQLFKALEEAKRQRLSRATKSESAEVDRLAGEESSVFERPIRPAQFVDQPTDWTGSTEQPLNDGNHQSVRYASRINHVVGSNGRTYATAFRPANVYAASQRSNLPLLYQPVSQSPNPVETLQRQHEQFERLRSKLPAPIYTPNSALPPFVEHSSSSSAFEIDHSAPGNTNWAGKSSANWAPPPAQMLHSSSAWSVLNNNYNTAAQAAQSTLLIDHSDINGRGAQSIGDLPNQQQRQQEADFEREASVLRSLNRQQVPQVNTFGMAYNYNQPQPTHGHSEAPNTLASSSSVSYGNRMTKSGYDFGLALKNFNPPLYHPEVHDTNSAALPVSPPAPGQVIYSSTILHSDIAAERDYKPERIVGGQPSSGGDQGETLWRSSTIIDHQRPKVAPVEPLFRPPAEGSSLGPVKYATRLTSLVQPQDGSADDEMLAANSEQIAAYQAFGNSSTMSRARMPDRSKKLSSIFKARSGNSSSEQDSNSSTLAKIRRPVPGNSRLRQQPERPKQQVEQQTALPVTATSTAAPVQVVHLEKEQPVEESNEQQQQVKPVKSLASGKKFGKSSEKVPLEFDQVRVVEHQPITGAKKRPILREPLKKLAETSEKPQFELATNNSLAANQVTSSPATRQVSDPTLEIVRTESSVLRMSNDAPTATIIDATNQSDETMRASLDKELYEKIVKIQQEIAAKSLSTKTNETKIQIPVDSNPTTESAPRQIITSPEPTSTTTTTTSTTARPTTTSSTTEAPVTTGADSGLVPDQKPTPNDGLKLQNSTTGELDSKVEEDKRFLTGSLVAMDLSIDQGEFLNRLTQDMYAFDNILPSATPTRQAPFESRRSATTSSPSNQSQVLAGEASTTPAPTISNKTAATVEIETRPPSSTAAPRLVTPPPATTTTTSTTTTTTTTTIPITSASAPMQIQLISSSLDTRNSSGLTSPVSTANQTIEISSSEPLAGKNETSSQVMVEQQIQVATNASKLLVQETTTTAAPAMESVQANATNAPMREVVRVAELDSGNQTRSLSTTTTTTTTTTPAPITTQTPVEGKKASATPRRSTAAPRFGRLVIKRGDRVVARFNASEPIPDSIIPIGGSAGSEIIMPDMPRLGMRRSVKKKLQPAQKQDNASSSTTTLPVIATTATAAPAPALTTTTAANGTNLDTRKASSQRGANNETNSALESAAASMVRSLRRRSGGLLREPRSSSEQKVNDELQGDLMVSESRTIADEMLDDVDQLIPLRELRKISADKEANIARPALSGEPSGQTGESLKPLKMKPKKSQQESEQVQQQAPISGHKKSARSSAVGRNWSSRLRESVAGAEPTNKRYDAKEDLRKLVEKISMLEETSDKWPKVSTRSARRLNGAEQQRASLMNGSQIEISRQTAPSINGSSSSPVIAEKLDQPARLNFSLAMASGEASNNQTRPGILVHVLGFDLNANSTNETGGNSSLGVPKIVGPVNSQLINVLTSERGQPAILMAEHSAAQTQANQTIHQVANYSLSGSNLEIANKSISSSASFTVNLSPALERNWERMQPIEPNSTLVTKSSLISAKHSPGEVRVDSHGHIHVRNNQSITVHVDIEPPKRRHLNQTSTSERQQSQATIKRLISRDTLAAKDQFGRDDIQRIPSSATRAESSKRMSDQQLIDVNYPRPNGSQSNQVRQVEVQDNAQRAAKLQQKRAPRMLCIEVDDLADRARGESQRQQVQSV